MRRNVDGVSNDVPVSVESSLITEELARRPFRAPDYQAESRALSALAREMSENPHGVLQKLVELVTELCHADSAGISILEPDGANGIFRWHAIVGRFAVNLGGGMPRDASPCGQVISRNSVLLFNEPERYYPALNGIEPRIYENLLAPWAVNGQPIGTVWAIGHSPDKHFDAEDARLLESLTSFASAAYQMIAALDEATAGKQELEQRVAERTSLLAQSNERLQHELEQRSRTEAALHAADAALEADLVRTRRLYQLHACLATETDLHAALDEILATACEFTGTDRGCVQLLSNDGKRLEIVAQRGYGPDSPFINHFRYEGFAEGCDVARVERRRLLIEDTTTFPGLVGTPEGEVALADGIRAAQSTPMISHNGETVGVLSTQFRQPHLPNDDELQLMDLLAWAAADFVERHHAETALRESEARFRALADASPALIWQLDVDGNAIYLNQRYLDVTGLTPEQLLATGWLSIVHPEHLPDYRATLDRALQQRSAFHTRIRARVKDNTWHWFESYGVPWFADTGNYRGHVGISIDITETVQAEEALKEADRRKDEFLATLAHELRNPLAPIRTSLELLGLSSDSPATVARVRQTMERQVAHLVHLVDDLLDLARINSGKIELKKSRIKVQEVVAQAIETTQHAIQAKRHILTQHVPEDPIWLDGDQTRLAQVIGNLLTNAAKYTPSGGEIELRVEREDDEAVIVLKDNGIGISEEALPHIFEMFTQVGHDIDQSQGGLGIGLSLVKRLTEKHGGSASASSAGPGKGSMFTLRLPVAEGDADATSGYSGRAQSSATAHQQLRILVADDNRDAAEVLSQLLQLGGNTVRVAYDGPGALDAARQFLPDLAILDIGMPVMNGYELARAIHRQPELRNIVLVAVTGWGTQKDKARSLEAGFDFHLTKPIDLATLTNLISHIKPRRK